MARSAMPGSASRRGAPRPSTPSPRRRALRRTRSSPTSSRVGRSGRSRLLAGSLSRTAARRLRPGARRPRRVEKWPRRVGRRRQRVGGPPLPVVSRPQAAESLPRKREGRRRRRVGPARTGPGGSREWAGGDPVPVPEKAKLHRAAAHPGSVAFVRSTPFGGRHRAASHRQGAVCPSGRAALSSGASAPALRPMARSAPSKWRPAGAMPSCVNSRRGPAAPFREGGRGDGPLPGARCRICIFL